MYIIQHPSYNRAVITCVSATDVEISQQFNDRQYIYRVRVSKISILRSYDPRNNGWSAPGTAFQQVANILEVFVVSKRFTQIINVKISRYVST